MDARFLRRFIMVGVAIPVLYLVNLFVTPELVGPNRLEILCRPRGSMEFDASLWNTSPAVWGESKRYEMVDNLLAKGRLIGLSEPDLKKLLGDANSVGNVSDDEALYYNLARQKDYPARSIWFPGAFPNHEIWILEVVLRQGKVHSARVLFN
jgi:hypothetical protein